MEIENWMKQYCGAVRAAFGDRVRYIGLQGSRGRGEAGPDSDIDVVCILDSCSLQDLETYRAAVKDLPDRDKLCGFVSGTAELAAWDRGELFQFRRDTTDWCGRLADLLPPEIRPGTAPDRAGPGASANCPGPESRGVPGGPDSPHGPAVCLVPGRDWPAESNLNSRGPAVFGGPWCFVCDRGWEIRSIARGSAMPAAGQMPPYGSTRMPRIRATTAAWAALMTAPFSSRQVSDSTIRSRVQAVRSMPARLVRNSSAPVRSVFSMAAFFSRISESVDSVKSHPFTEIRSQTPPEKLT